ncbi:MAG: PAS domain S-box protein [Pseudomonadota bacterium]|jgi:PAS domain S-box-containing protein
MAPEPLTGGAAAHAADVLAAESAGGDLAQDLADYTALAAALCGAPVAAVSMLGARHQHLVARLGIDLARTSRDLAFIDDAAADRAALAVADAAADPRFADHPLVCGAPKIAAFAGVGLADAAGRSLGSLFVAWHAPHRPPAAAIDGLRRLARQVERRIQREAAPGGTDQAQDSAHAGDRRFRRALEALDHVAVQAFRPDGRINFWNRASEALYGWRADEALGADIIPLLFPPEARDAERALLARVAGSADLSAAGEVELLRRDGSRTTIYAARVLVPSADGEPEFFCFDVDINARRAAENALRASERRLREITDAIPGAILRFMIRPDGRYLIDYISRGCSEIWEIDADSIVADSTPLRAMVLPEDQPGVLESVRQSARTLQPWRHQWRIRTPSGRLKWLAGSGIPAPTGVGGVLWNSFIVDRTAQARAETALARSEARYRAIAENIPGAIFRYLLHPDGRHSLEFISGGAGAIWERDPQSLRADVGLLTAAMAPEDRDGFRATIDHSAATLVEWHYRWQINTPSGRRKWLQGNGRPARSDDGTVAWDGYVFEISELHAAEAALALSEARLRVLLESAPEALVVLDVEAGRFVDFNGKSCRLFGIQPERMRELDLAAVSPAVQPDGRASVDALRAVLQRAAAWQEVVFDWTHQRADGTEMPCEVHLVRIPDATRTLVRGSIVDVTERKRAEQALRESERRFRSLVEDIPTIAAQGYDRERRVTFWNKGSEQLYGWTAAEATGQRMEDLIVPPAMHAAVAEAHARWMREGRIDVPWEERVLVDRSGLPVPVFSSHSLQPQPDGEPALYCLDVDLRDLRRTEAALQQANAALQQRNDELQQFVMVASHDLQEPLRKMQAFADRLRDSTTGRLSMIEQDYLERLERAATRMRELIQDLLDYSAVSLGTPQRVPVDLGAVLAEVVEDLGAAIASSDGRVDSTALPVLPADPVQMRQLLQNLVGNALKYRSPARPPRVLVDASRVDLPGGPYWRLRVSDNGIGFDDAHRERIFVPFQRLHARAEIDGTGIGLAIVRRIAERHGGAVEARGRAGEGAEFLVLLPTGGDPVSAA